MKSSKLKVKSSKLRRGFSLVELIFIMSIIALLLGLTTINLSGAQRQATLQAVVQDFISDLKLQQIKAMIGDTEGRTGLTETPPYGIHIDSNQYVLFYGTSYDETDTSNFKISLPTNMQFTSPSTEIIFARITGETPTVTVTLKDAVGNSTKAIQLNKYGVVIRVN